ncbi:5'-methylthioadenosine phosphorylase [Thermosporothrix hazakensis]|jgi:5'-methylthioadenosine phosphorylase|uniref:S-methyl-5'-thioadenosine phosphorylase n=2 Tax=Thermosporothrix TaxID=768650 RepID=A0A326UFV9_THEHA|nr:S-methyl-5'-thioadenosine phosphorylase [Thermosporothrix hazakensis]PZW35900.1 5'-methylthioadenosine phosphorylase [Thermosporothrix hazakensis]BBH88367.1 S-methyl-5'-thioadenosine phosphorylase [Thermosporothrix sp. COM3]GCE46554.1 S-methyl-5'-thioadenosine phosphorylase [Thermosporothrix hazakensis]
MPQATIGVIGGSGLYRMEHMTEVEEVKISTPFGDPSDVITIGKVNGVSMAFLPRHGRGHRLNPTEIPVRANIWALKSLGVEYVISVSAVGSLREDYAPRDLVIPDQLFDRTKSRVNSFFEGGLVVHATFAEPFCPHLSKLLLESARELKDVTVHAGGTYVCMEGPLFSTKAESNTYRKLGMDIIGMTALPEAKLAREAELCYATVACVTDYDCWHEAEESVTVEMVVQNLAANVKNAQRILQNVAQRIPADRAQATCGCSEALATAIMTDRSAIPAEVKEKYSLLVKKYL